MTKRPLKFKMDAYRLYKSGFTPLESFKRAGELNEVSLSGCMTTKAYASSYMSDDIRNYLRKRKDDLEVIDYFNKWGLDLTF